MVSISVLSDVIEEGKELIEKTKSKEREITRELINRRNKETIEVLYGVRRAGKSTILLQIGKKFENSYYINFEDERLISLKAQELAKIENLVEKESILLLDEVQNVKGWEKFVNRMQRLNYKIYVTGSNSSLLKGEYAGSITGRAKRWKITPLSFREYAKEKKERGIRALEKYLVNGGFPYFVFKGEDLSREYLEDIMYKDIIIRYKLREERELIQLVNYVVSNPSSILTSKKLSSLTGLSRPTVLKFLHYLEEVFLIVASTKFGKSLKVSMLNPIKSYTIDNSFSKKSSKGRLLENTIAQHLSLKQKLNYWKNYSQWEVDFLTDNYAIQVSYELNEENIKREMRSLAICEKETKRKPLLIYMYSDVDLPSYAIRADRFLLNL